MPAEAGSHGAHKLMVSRQCMEEGDAKKRHCTTLYANGAGITMAAAARPGR